MIDPRELAALIQKEREQEAAMSRLARIARLYRRCCEVSESTLDLIARALRRPCVECAR